MLASNPDASILYYALYYKSTNNIIKMTNVKTIVETIFYDFATIKLVSLYYPYQSTLFASTTTGISKFTVASDGTYSSLNQFYSVTGNLFVIYSFIHL